MWSVIKCHLHNSVDATARCVVCGRGLCSPCADRYNLPYCDGCADISRQAMVKSAQSPLVVTAVAAGVGFVLGLMSAGEIAGALMTAWVAMAVCWGWYYIKPIIFASAIGSMAFGLAGILVFPMIVGMSVGIAMFIGPFFFIRDIIQYNRAKAQATKARS